MSDTEAETTENNEVLETPGQEISQDKKDMYLAIFMELCKSHRFNKFLNDNFTFSQMVDDEKREIDLRIIEKPVVVGSPLSIQQVKDIYKVCSGAGVIDTQALVSKILEILGQETKGLIIPGN